MNSQKAINVKKIQSEFARILDLYPKIEGVDMSHDDKGVWITIFTKDGLSEYEFDESYLEGEE